MKVNTATRLKQIMSERNLKQVDIIRLTEPYQNKLGIKMGKSTLSQYINGIQNPDQDRIYLLSKSLGVSEPWLMGYDVPKDRIPDGDRNRIIHTTLTQITDTSAKLAEPKQKEVLSFVKNKLKEQLQEQNTNIPSNPLGKVVHFPTKNGVSANNQEEIEETISYGAVSAGTGEYLFGLERAETVWLPKRKFPTQSFDYVLKINGDSMEPTYQHGEYIFVKSFANGGEVRDGMLAIVLYDNEVYFKKLYIESDHARLVSLNKDYPEIVITDPKEFTVLGKVVL